MFNEFFPQKIYIVFLFMSVLISFEVLIASYFAKVGENILNVATLSAYFSCK